MTTRTITLTRNAQTQATAFGQQGYRFTVTSVGTNMPSEIFRYLRVTDGLGNPMDIFDGVCRPDELVDLPTSAPASNSNPPWLRLATLDLIFASQVEAQNAWTDLQNKITTLLEALHASDILGPGETWSVTV
jgi:hypothetical protein